MRIAVLADVHGNLPALQAVLDELDAEPVDAIVVAGDVCGGPLVRAALELLSARPEPVHWISGNSERETVGQFDGAPVSDDPAGRADAWSAAQLDRAVARRAGVLAGHGHAGRRLLLPRLSAPRRRDPHPGHARRRRSPTRWPASASALVVGGHTHQQLIRELPGGPVYVNAGSVGLPYEGQAGRVLAGRATTGPRSCARPATTSAPPGSQLRAAGFPDLDDFLGDSLLRPVDPDWVTAFFEHRAGPQGPPGRPAPGLTRPRSGARGELHGIRLMPWMKAERSSSGSPASMSGITRSISPKIARSWVLASEAPRQ